MTAGNRRRFDRRLGALLAAALVAGGCSSVKERDGPPSLPTPRAEAPAPVPRPEPLSRYGNMESYEVYGKRYYTLKSSEGFVERGIASWYGKKFHGRRTSSGEPYDMYQMTAAHKHLPLPTYVEVKNLENGRTAVLRVNDRGPFHEDRVIDLSYAAARKLGVVEKGTALVEVRAVSSGDYPPRPARMAKAAPLAPEPEEKTPVYLQIGAFADRRNAERLTHRLSGTIPDGVRIAESSDTGELVYRVQVGPIADVDLAEHVVEVLARLGINQHHFVLN